MKKLLAVLILTIAALGFSACKGEEEMTNIEEATTLINTFATGDSELAGTLLKEDYIQHNLAYATGREAFMGAVNYLGSAEVKTTVETVRGFEDGEYVVLQNKYNFSGSGDVVAFDIFRFEDGLIVEHWDVMESIASENIWQNTNGKF